MAKGWLDNYGKEDNYNDSSVSAPEGFQGDGYSNVGRNYSPAWGGQFQMGGNVYPVNYVPQAAMGGSLPGATGHMYARVGAPSNGKYAKHTLASAQDGKKVKYGTPEYEEAYNKGEVITKEGVRSPILLDEVVVKGKKKNKNWLEQYADKIVDENKDAGVLGAILGTPISAVTSLPQLMGMKAFTGEMERPSEALGIENPYGAMAVDAIADPTNLIGVGELSGLSKLGKEKALAKLAASKESGLLSRAHEINPWAFKPNSEAYYRGIGRTGLDNALESGYLRANNNKLYGEDVYMTPEFNMAKGQYSRNQPYSVGDIWGDDWKMVDPTDSKSYIAEIPKNKLTNPEVKGKLVTINKGPLPIDDVKLYKQHWLQGYKEVPKPASNFESEIDWAKWNKEIPENSQLIKEYNAIEKTSKANGSWMKNPDGSEFKGTPEQFVQQNSKNFKKAYPEGFEETYRGIVMNQSAALRPGRAMFTGDENLARGYSASDDFINSEELINEGGMLKLIYPKSENSLIHDTRGSDWQSVNVDAVDEVSKTVDDNINSLQKTIDRKKKSLETATYNPSERYWEFPDSDVKLDMNVFLEGTKPEEEMLNKLLNIKEKGFISTNPKILSDIKSKLGKRPNTDEIAEYIEKNNVDHVTLKNIQDGSFGDISIINHKPGNYLKSAIGNNGMFDMSNANIFKTVIPGAIGLGALQQKREGGVIKDDMGQWAHPGEVTEINSNDITMEGVPYDVLGISDTGDTKLMKPGKNYKFKGKKVTEYPMAKNGLRQEQKGLQNLDQLTNFTNYNTKQPGGWLDTL